MAKNMTNLKKIIKGLDKGKQELAMKLFKRAEFMENTLCELEKTIKEEGAVITAVNGNGFEVTSEHPAQKSYNTMIGRYNAIIKSLADMLPEGEQNHEDEFLSFVRR